MRASVAIIAALPLASALVVSSVPCTVRATSPPRTTQASCLSEEPSGRVDGWIYEAEPRIARRREAIFLAGLPGSGKTRIIKNRFGFSRESESVLDLDKEIVSHEAYDPTNRAAVYDVPGAYEWADERVERAFQRALSHRHISRIVLDGTGTKVQRRQQRMDAARAAGMVVKLLYVRVELATALKRNARRLRKVARPPTHVTYHTVAQYPAALSTAGAVGNA